MRIDMRATFTVLTTCVSLGVASLGALAGCSPSVSAECLDESQCSGPGVPPPGRDVGSQVVPLCADTGIAHVGLGGVDLASGRVVVAAGLDRGRSKPYSALATEYARVLGKENNPTLLASTGTTFGVPDARWFLEPQASAVSLYTAYRVAFDGCLQFTGAVDNANGAPAPGGGEAKYTLEPDEASATAECQAWARKFWSRAASPDEVRACVEVAVTSSAQETYNDKTTDTPPRRRWAYACASVLSATGFLAY